MKIALLLALFPWMTISVSQAAPAPKPLSVMFYNVQNLFDTVHDPRTNDWAFTPKNTPGKTDGCLLNATPFYIKECKAADWTDARLALKLQQIKTVLTKGRALPDILGLEEVENLEVAQALAKVAGYDGVAATYSPHDGRGLDVALLWRKSSRFEKLEAIEHAFNFEEAKAKFSIQTPGVSEAQRAASFEARNVLEVRFKVYGKSNLSVYVTHWPSQYFGTDYRRWYGDRIRELIEVRMKADPSTAILVGGDFNIADTDVPDPALELLNPIGGLDMEELHFSTKSDQPPGSFYLKSSNLWSHLDRLFYYGGTSSLRPIGDSWRIYAPDFAATTYTVDGQSVKAPYKYNHAADLPAQAGYSDHFASELQIGL